jgi:hypothetical protein
MQPAAGPTYTATGAQGGQQPSQAVPTTTQSEPTPQNVTPPFDTRPYGWVAQHDPGLKGIIDDAAQANGIDPERLAWHLNKESNFRQEDANGRPLRGTSGEIGMGQLMPGTAQELSDGGKLDPFNLRDNVFMAARYIRKMDGLFGKNSPSSFAAYNGGPGGVNGEHAREYSKSAFPTANLSDKDFVGKGTMTAPGLVHAGVNGGPDGFFSYMVNTAPAGMPVTDAWRHAEGMLVTSFLMRGDLAGAQHAQDWVAQMAHVGSNQYLMGAYNSLQAGDGVGAAQALAKAHAFFPDGTIGRFRTDGKNVYAERLDEHDPSQRVGPPSMITPNDIAGLLNQTKDPNKFLQTLMEQQKNVADTRLANQHGDYYANLGPERERAAQMRADAQIEAANLRAQAATDAANTRADSAREVADIRGQYSAAGAAQQAALNRMIDKETDTKFNTLTNPDIPPEKLGAMAEVYSDVRRTGYGDRGLSPPQADNVARGLSNGTLTMIRQTDGRYRVTDPNDKNAAPVAYVSQALGDHLAGARAPDAQQGHSPIGAAPTTPMGRGMIMGSGTTNNLSGTVTPNQQPQQPPVSQSSALPVSQ